MTCPVKDDHLLADLTAEQRAAVTHDTGQLMVLAGAGAGKTRVLCRRLAWLVDNGRSPEELVALTFTAKAAEELRERAEELIRVAHDSLRVGTFHAYAREILRVHGVDHGLTPARELVGEEERKLLLLERLEQLELRAWDLRGDTTGLIDRFIRRIDRCRDELVGPDDFLAWAEEARATSGSRSLQVQREKDVEFARVFVAHDRWLAEEGLEDFGAAIVRALGLLREHPDRLEAVSASARHILIDEFQDTNHAQAELLGLLGARADSVVAVGDDDQGIYRFRGASTKNVVDFRRRFPNAAEIRLEANYRSSQAILDCAAAVVAPVPDRAPKNLVAVGPDARGPWPEFWVAQDVEAQARAVAGRARRLAEEGTPLEQQAVLMRAVRTEARPIVDVLERAGIPHQVRGGTSLFERREVRAGLAWLRALTRLDDVQAHLRLAADAPEVPWVEAAQAVSEAGGEAAVTRALRDVAEVHGDEELPALLDELGRLAQQLDPIGLVRAVLDIGGLRAAAIAAGGAEGAARLAGLAALEKLTRDICHRRPGIDSAGLVDVLQGLADAGYRGEAGAPAEASGLQVMTVHQAKGLEFDVVYVVGLTAAGWPGSDRSTPDIPDQLLPEALPRGREAHQAEARRLAYVAMTRARHTLVLSYPERAPSGAPNRPSPYYDEARAVAGDPDVRRVGRSAAVRLLEAVGEARARHEAASAAAARAIARGEAATSEQAAVSEAAKALATARGEALAGAKEAPSPLPESDRPRSVHGVTLSPTDIEQYRTCPLAYRYARIDRIPTPPSADRAIGVAAHTALEAHYRPGGSGGDGAALVQRFEQELPATARAGVDAARAQQALERAREWLPKYHDRFIKAQLKPVAVERAFTLPIGSHRVRGRIDRVDEHPAGGTQLVDYKTGRPPLESQRGGDNLVLRLYLAGARDAWGIYARGATLEYVFDGRATPVNPDTQEVEEALTEAGRIADGIARGDFEPKPGWACRSCDFAGLCPAQER